jgi:hypothetical protein
MRRLFSALFIIIFTGLSLPHTATAAASTIELIEQPHQLIDGRFLNDELATLLAPEGKIGSLVFTPAPTQARWIIDASFLDEVADMADGYELVDESDGQGVDVAAAFLAQLKIATAGAVITPTAYGNPDLVMAQQLAPSELLFYFSYGAERVSFHLGREIEINKSYSGAGRAKISGPLRKNYTVNRQAISKLSTVVTAPELRLFRARLAILLSPSINGDLSERFAQSAIAGVAQQREKLRINPGKYALTSETVEVPLTLVNGFDSAVTVNLIFRSSNIKVLVADMRQITLEPNSRTQFAVPFTVVASGATNVSAALTNTKGQWLGPASQLTLTMTLIDSRVAWFTTGAAILLFVGAAAQTYRRVRKGRYEK